MPNIESLPLTVQKLLPRLKLTTDTQDKNNMPLIYQSGGIKSYCSINVKVTRSLIELGVI